MSTLARVYDDKKNTETDITTRKTYLLGVDELYVEPGYNVRETDQAHVEEFRDAFIAGEHVPPLAVQVTEHGIKVIDGHHRYFGAKLAQEAGYELRLECKDFVGSEADRIAFMVTSSQGRALLPLERAAAYQRLVNQGWEPAEIAKKVKRSVTDVEQHLQLLTVGDGLIDMVKSGEVAATTAIALQREHGAKASTVAQQQMQKAKAAGKKKLTKAAAMPQFSAVKARRLVELLCDAQSGDEEDGVTALYHNSSYTDEIMSILAEYREGIPGTEKDLKPEMVQEQQGGEELPLKRVDILEQSGVETMACAVAAFGMKHEYTFSESKYAHVWASDSVEKPEVMVVPPDTIQKAKRIIQEHQDDLELKLWVAENFEGPDEESFNFRRFASVLIEVRLVKPCTVREFLELVEQTDRSCWDNVRMLRGAVKELIGDTGQAA
ncbi:chromosome partitioning protein ParB [Pantoea sp. SJZ147]|uniref:ParB/RepB/Spo0J family partition protein n=1 Tax=Pantoea sp. SJZ147 TaxID=2572896 RepID=UPI00119DE64D|nr:chromosome partitioning protein ParB [Pantoea sp. SJZ147]TWD32320.1 ParB family chromosome partitioning protein [Pantoea sp. SJZ147]